MTKRAIAVGMVAHGISALPIEISATATPGTGTLTIDSNQTEFSKREVRVRVLSSLAALGIYGLEGHNVVVALDLRFYRGGLTSLDLPIAVAILRAIGVVPPTYPEHGFAGELSLAGNIHPVRGVSVLLDGGPRVTVVPYGNAAEAGLYGTARLAKSLRDVLRFLKEEHKLETPRDTWLGVPGEDDAELFDFPPVSGQVLRALEIAAAGEHNVLLIGPHGSGKTRLARLLRELLPAPLPRELLGITKVHSVAGIVPDKGYVDRRPFRAPHHTVSEAGLFGGGVYHRPGEVSLADRGVLFLDEVLEFRAPLIERLRADRRNGQTGESIAAAHFPHNPLLCASAPACACHGRPCTCHTGQTQRLGWHRGRLRALSDLFDISVHVDWPDSHTEPLPPIRERVARAREFGEALPIPGSDLVRDPVLARLARTIANLEGSTQINTTHVDEAQRLRTFT